MRFHAFAARLLAWVLAAPMAAQQPSSSVTDLAQAPEEIRDHSRTSRPTSAHTYQGGVLKKQITEKAVG